MRAQVESCGKRLAGMVLVAGLAMLFAPPAGRAQTTAVTFAGLPATVGYGLQNPDGVAVDGASNVYITENSSTFSGVIEVPVGCASSACQVTLYTSSYPHVTAVAVDRAGDLFIYAQTANLSPGYQVVEIPAGCTSSSCQVVLGGSSNYIDQGYSLAVDATGDLFIGYTGSEAIYEVPASCIASGTQSCWQAITPQYGIPQLIQVVVDAAGDVFFTSNQANNHYVAEVPARCASVACQVILWSDPSSLTAIGGVGVDAAGNVFFYYEHNAQPGSLLEIPAQQISAGCTSTSSRICTTTTVLSGLGFPTNGPGNQFAFDAFGDIFVTDTSNSRVVELERFAPGFGYVNVGSNSTLMLTYNINDTVSLAASPKVVTQGGANLDFTLSSTNVPACTGRQTAPATCTVTVQFAPIVPGLRQGAVLLYDNSNNLLVTTLIRGIGTGPQLVFPGAQQITVSQTGGPSGVATDAAGDVYFSNTASGIVSMIPAGCSSSSCYQSLGGGLSFPLELAVDGAGNIYVPDLSNNQVYLIPPGCGSFSCQTKVGNGFGGPAAVALDGAGDIFVAENTNSDVAQVRVAGPQTTMGNLTQPPFGVALDKLGDVFIADQSGGFVEVPSVGAQSQFASQLASSSNYGSSVATDAAGDVYAAQETAVTQVPPGCGSTACDVRVGNGGYQFVSGVALDNAGDVYIADKNAGALYEVQRSQAPAVTFPGTPVNTTSSPITVAVQNIGNQPLTLTSFSVGGNANFNVDTDTTTCSTTAALAPGGVCNIGVDFTPSSVGSFTGTLNITDNTLNGSGVTQSVPLSGTGPTTPAVTVAAITTTYGSTAAVTASATFAGSSGVVPSGTVTFSAATGTFSAATCAPSGAVLSCASTYTPSGTLAANTYAGYISASILAAGSYNAAFGTATLAVNRATATVTLSNLMVTYDGSPQSPTITTVPAGLTTSLSGGADTPSLCVLDRCAPYRPLNRGLGWTNAGSYRVTATITNPNYTGSASGTFVINKATATVTLGNLTATYNGSPQSPTVTTAPAGLSYSLTGAPDTNAGSYPVTASVSNPNYTGSASDTFVINPATATVTLGNLTVTYNGSPQSPTVTTVPAGLTTSLTGVPGTNAGSYAVTATVTNTNYTGSASGTFVINPAAAMVTLGNLTATYNGSPQSPTVTTVPSGLSTSLIGAPDTNAGSYAVTATITNPNYTGSASGTFVINPAAATVTLGNLTVTYNGSPQSPTVTTAPGGLSTSFTGAPDSNAGSYPVTAAITNPNYTGSASGTFVINPAAATVTLGNLTATYNGSPQSPTVTTMPAGLTTSLTGAPDTNAGSYAVTATITNANYTGSASGTFVINKAAATVTLGSLAVTYNGSPQSPTVTTVPAGLSTSLTGAPDTNIGSYPVTATITNSNYTGSASGTFVINKGTATVTLGNLTVAYTGSPQSPTVITVPSGLSTSLTGAPDTNVGSYPVTATVTDPNYTGSASGTFVINKATATVTLGNLTVTYNGSPQSPTVTTVPAGLSYSLTGAPDTNAGSYAVTATITDPNYTGSASGTFVINKAAATVTLGNLTVAYTGSPQSPTVTTVPSGLSTSLTGAPDTNAGSYAVTATITNANYTGSASGTFVINKATATVTLGNLTVTYNGSPQSPTVTTVPAGLSTSLTGAPDTNAGSYAVTATITSPNYTGSASGTFVINKATATVTLGNLTVTHNGSPQSPTVTTVPAGLSYSLTGAPDTNPGSYAVTATVTDPNYTGSASGTFVIK